MSDQSVFCCRASASTTLTTSATCSVPEVLLSRPATVCWSLLWPQPGLPRHRGWWASWWTTAVCLRHLREEVRPVPLRTTQQPPLAPDLAAAVSLADSMRNQQEQRGRKDSFGRRCQQEFPDVPWLKVPTILFTFVHLLYFHTVWNLLNNVYFVF